MLPDYIFLKIMRLNAIACVLQVCFYFFFFFDIPASDKAIAIPCFVDLTILPLLPEWSVPFLNSLMTLPTLASLAFFVVGFFIFNPKKIPHEEGLEGDYGEVETETIDAPIPTPELYHK